MDAFPGIKHEPLPGAAELLPESRRVGSSGTDPTGAPAAASARQNRRVSWPRLSEEAVGNEMGSSCVVDLLKQLLPGVQVVEESVML